LLSSQKSDAKHGQLHSISQRWHQDLLYLIELYNPLYQWKVTTNYPELSSLYFK